jgi:hypothetical protein
VFQYTETLFVELKTRSTVYLERYATGCDMVSCRGRRYQILDKMLWTPDTKHVIGMIETNASKCMAVVDLYRPSPGAKYF